MLGPLSSNPGNPCRVLSFWLPQDPVLAIVTTCEVSQQIRDLSPFHSLSVSPSTALPFKSIKYTYFKSSKYPEGEITTEVSEGSSSKV